MDQPNDTFCIQNGGQNMDILINAATKTHPSVRVKGTEDNYEPIACRIAECPKRSPHMHCPFCIKTDSFIDPVILKAHYRVKHVDKGIEFAGLKILRCCDQCSIVGSIKNSKEFKGAHWHCYNCRNGFNRRDEALKHYKTHFRNPMTTFQIQITHDINAHMMRLPQQVELDHAIEGLPDDTGGLLLPKTHPWVVSNETIISSVQDTADLSQEDSVLDCTQEQIGREISLTCTTSDGVPRLILAEPQQQQGTGGVQDETQYFIVGENGKLTAAGPPVVSSQQVLTEGFVQTEHLEKDQLVARITLLESEMSDMENVYQQKLLALQNQVDEQQKKISSLEHREQELLNQLRQNLSEEHVSDILSEMKSKQEELLNQCLNKLKRSKTSSQNDPVTTETDAHFSQAVSIVAGDSKSNVMEIVPEEINATDISINTSQYVIESNEAPSHMVSRGNVKEETISGDLVEVTTDTEQTGTSTSDSVQISVPVSSTELCSSMEGVSQIFIDNSGNNQQGNLTPKLVKLPLSGIFNSTPVTSSSGDPISEQGQVIVLVQSGEGSQIPILESQNEGLISCTESSITRDNHEESGIGTSSYCMGEGEINGTDTTEELVTTQTDDIINMGDYVSTSNVDVITEVSTTGSELDVTVNHEEIVLEKGDYTNSSACIVNNAAVSEHQYAVIEHNIEVQGDNNMHNIINSNPSDVKIVTLRKRKRTESTSPETSPICNRSKRNRKSLIKESL